MYDAGREAIKEVQLGKEMHRTHENVALWPSVFTGMQIIANRTTRYHRDPGAASTYYDLLLSLGTHTTADLSLPEFGAHLYYPPGSIVQLSGKIFLHGVEDWEGGERICLAHMMKDNVHGRLNIQRPTWPETKHYKALVGK